MVDKVTPESLEMRIERTREFFRSAIFDGYAPNSVVCDVRILLDYIDRLEERLQWHIDCAQEAEGA